MVPGYHATPMPVLQGTGVAVKHKGRIHNSEDVRVTEYHVLEYGDGL